MAAERVRLGQAILKRLGPGETAWDSVVLGFHARRQRGEAVSFLVTYRTREGRQRFQKIGVWGSPWTADEARAEARRILGEVAAGRDPAAERERVRTAPTVAELCDLYLSEAAAGRLMTRRGAAKKASTLDTDRSRIEAHIRPLLGRMRVEAVTRRDVEAFMHAVAEGRTATDRVKLDRPRATRRVTGGRGSATRVMGLLGAIMAFAVARGLRDDNPIRGVTRPADGRRERRLTADEFARLGLALREAERVTPGEGGRPDRAAMWPAAVAAIRFLCLTGWRRGEATGLRWRDVDLSRRTVTLADSKTGRSVRPLSRRACDLLAGLGPREPDAFVFPAARGAGEITLPSYVERIRSAAGLGSDVTPHVLRHSFASVAGDCGLSELTIAALLGHRAASVTSRYVHALDSVLLAAADRVADEIARQMGDAAEAAVIEFPSRGAAGA